MCELLRAVLPHCYRAAAVAAPHAVQDACLQLVKHNTSFIKQQHRDAYGVIYFTAHVHHWPSWLIVGNPKII